VKTVALVGVPWNLHELAAVAEAAKALGRTLSVVDTRSALATIAESIPCGRTEAASTEDEDMLRAVSALNPEHVISTTELRLGQAARIREAMGLPGNPAHAELAVSDKLRTRTVLEAAGLTSVRYAGCSLSRLPEEIARWDRPVVVKPRALAGSNGVRLIEGPADLEDMYREYDVPEAAAQGRDEVIIESFIPGTEISAEGLAVDGRLRLLSLTDKINTGTPYFQEVGHVLPSALAERRGAEVASYLQRAIKALGITTAPIHAELKLEESRGVEMVEIHTRFGGGNIVRLLSLSLGLNPFELYLRALTDAELPTTAVSATHWGVGFFTARSASPFHWTSFDFPHPEAVVELELDALRAPKLLGVQGIRFRYRRCGHALFQSEDHAAVAANIRFMTGCFPH
jgi:biotin carboxylase